MSYSPQLTAAITAQFRASREQVASDAAAKLAADEAARAAEAEAAVAARIAEAEAAKVVVEGKPAEEVVVVAEVVAETKETAKPVTFKAAYVSDDGVVYGIGAYATNIDLDDEILQTKALVKMSYDFCASSKRVFKANHKEKLDADLVASMPGAPILKSGRVLAAGEDVPEDDPVTGICLKSEPVAWFVGVRPKDPEIAKTAKAGGIAGFSFGAFVERQEV